VNGQTRSIISKDRHDPNASRAIAEAAQLLGAIQGRRDRGAN